MKFRFSENYFQVIVHQSIRSREAHFSCVRWRDEFVQSLELRGKIRICKKKKKNNRVSNKSFLAVLCNSSRCDSSSHLDLQHPDSATVTEY